MLSMKQLVGVRVYKTKPASRREQKKGADESTKRVGKVHNLVFSPDGKRVVGLMVKRPDIAGMVKRDDVFLALDSMGVIDGGLVCTRGDDSFDARACKRLGLPLDECIIWGGMDVATRSGKPLGFVDDLTFSPKTGRLASVSVSEGSMANAVVGTVIIDADMVVGYAKGHMVVDDEAAGAALTGGFAAKAGEATAKAKIRASEVGSKASKAVGEAVDKGSYGLGRVIGKAKRAVNEAMQDEAEPAQVEALDVVVEGDSPKRLHKGADGDVSTKGTYVPKSGLDAAEKGNNAEAGAAEKDSAKTDAPKRKVTKKAGSKKAAGTKGAKSSKAAKGKKSGAEAAGVATKKASHAVAKQLGKTRGMFGAFVEEFEKNSK
ncbi:PRC-barrel domain-containing protein [Atopobiaceae bacterium SGI.236]